LFLAQSLEAQIDIKERKDLIIDQNTYLDVAGELRCPTCTGLSVLDSDAAFSVQIKNQVKEQLAAGKTEKEIFKFFVDRYGPWILRSPPVAGVNALAWIVPITAMILGPLLIWVILGRRKKSLTSGSSSAEAVRSTEEIVKEMKQLLFELKASQRST
jgi:cytochrome c-type biogenesis protein CcmH/NrfF